MKTKLYVRSVLCSIPAMFAVLAALSGDARAETVGTVNTGGPPLHYRLYPFLSAPIMGSISNDSDVLIVCTEEGQSVDGTYGESNIWDMLTNSYYVADTYVYTGTNEPVEYFCGSE